MRHGIGGVRFRIESQSDAIGFTIASPRRLEELIERCDAGSTDGLVVLTVTLERPSVDAVAKVQAQAE